MTLSRPPVAPLPSSSSNPHPGTSYNPTAASHSRLLLDSLQRIKGEEAVTERLKFVKEGSRAYLETMEPWQYAELDVDPVYARRVEGAEDATEAEEEEDKEAEEKEGKAPSKRKNPRLKKRAAANRAKDRLVASTKAKERYDRNLIRSLPSLVKSLDRQQSELKERGINTNADLISALPELKENFQLTEELVENLRSLKPEGNLWKEWQVTNQRKGRMENRKPINYNNRLKSFKMVEKFAFKYFK